MARNDLNRLTFQNRKLICRRTSRIPASTMGIMKPIHTSAHANLEMVHFLEEGGFRVDIARRWIAYAGWEVSVRMDRAWDMAGLRFICLSMEDSITEEEETSSSNAESPEEEEASSNNNLSSPDNLSSTKPLINLAIPPTSPSSLNSFPGTSLPIFSALCWLTKLPPVCQYSLSP